jgi:hypothetical protein
MRAACILLGASTAGMHDLSSKLPITLPSTPDSGKLSSWDS